MLSSNRNDPAPSRTRTSTPTRHHPITTKVTQRNRKRVSRRWQDIPRVTTRHKTGASRLRQETPNTGTPRA